MDTPVGKINVMQGLMWRDLYKKMEYTRKRSDYRHVGGGHTEKKDTRRVDKH